MKEGSLFSVIEFPQIWPPQKAITIIQQEMDGYLFTLSVVEEGRLLLRIGEEEFLSQKIIFKKSHRGLLSISWNKDKEPKINVNVNSLHLQSSENSEPFLVDSKEHILEKKLSFQTAEADSKCKKWREWRNEKYGNLKKEAKKERVLKTQEHQFQELRDSLDILRNALSHVYVNENIFLITVLPLLRSLLFWPDKKSKNYNPLLFRLAGYLNLDLPVFAFKDRISQVKENSLFKDAVGHLVNNHPSLQQKNPNEEIIDFQEWIEMEMILIRNSEEVKTYRWKDIIFEAANTISASHFDDDIPVIIDKLKKAIAFDQDLFLNYILTITKITIDIGSYIIHQEANSKIKTKFMSSTYISTYLVYPPNLPDEPIKAISGALINKLFLDKPIPYDKFADITYEEEFEGLEVPQSKIIKMSKKEYIDDFFENGNLLIGTLESFHNDSPEIGDNSEGSFIVVGKNTTQTAFAEIGSGFNNYVFCCYDGEPDQEIIDKFGYNDYLEIIDVKGFSEAISKSLKANRSYRSKCLYKKDKVLVGSTPDNFNFYEMSGRLKELVNETKYFLKTSNYKHQQEYRFLWELDNDIKAPLIINCKEAIKYCKRSSESIIDDISK